MSKPTAYVFEDDGIWYLLYYRPYTHVRAVEGDVRGGSPFGVADFLRKYRDLKVEPADLDQQSWGRTILKDQRKVRLSDLDIVDIQRQGAIIAAQASSNFAEMKVRMAGAAAQCNSQIRSRKQPPVLT